VKFRCERDVLADALVTAGRAASRVGSLSVLSGIRLDLAGSTLTVTGTDLDTTIRLEVTVDGQRDGSAVVPARLVSDIVKTLPAGAVEMSLADDEVRISAGRADFTVRPLVLAEYPVIADPQVEAVRLATSDVADALRQVVRAAGSDDRRRVLTGVLFVAEETGVKLVATDSYRLAVRDLPQSEILDAGQRVLVPSRALVELQRLLGNAEEMTVRLGVREAVFEVGGTRLTTRLIEGEYPNYRSLVPSTSPNVLTISRLELLEALRRVKTIAQDPMTPVRIGLAGDVVTLAVSQDVGNATELIDGLYVGEEMTIAFNPEYLSSGIDALEGDEFTLSVVAPMKPAVLRGVGHDDYLYLLMPVRVP